MEREKRKGVGDMDDAKLEAVFGLLRQYVPRAPQQTVERMVRTVNKLEMEKARRNQGTVKKETKVRDRSAEKPWRVKNPKTDFRVM